MVELATISTKTSTKNPSRRQRRESTTEEEETIKDFEAAAEEDDPNPVDIYHGMVQVVDQLRESEKKNHLYYVRSCEAEFIK